MQYIEGGVTAAKGFLAGGVHCGIRKNKSKADLALIYSEQMCTAAGVYTQNLVKGAPILVTQKNLENGHAQAVICNSGNANTCNADGEAKAWRMCEIAADALHIDPHDVIVASTGVIGQILPIEPIENAAEALVQSLSDIGSNMAAKAIMTTDTREKEVAASFALDGKTVTVGGIAKGSGMIHPNMATMLCFVTTDCAISAAMLQKAIKKAADTTFNMISVDGDTSTNDTLTVMANGAAENAEITAEGAAFDAFCEALTAVCKKLSMMMAGDGEGATKLLICKTTGAKDWETAKTVAKSVICSSLLKAAMFGEDANWGRVLCVVGYCGITADMKRVDVRFSSKAGEILLCKNGAAVNFDEEKALEILKQDEVDILVDLNMGLCDATAWGCDLSYDYVRISGGYRRQ